MWMAPRKNLWKILDHGVRVIARTGAEKKLDAVLSAADVRFTPACAFVIVLKLRAIVSWRVTHLLLARHARLRGHSILKQDILFVNDLLFCISACCDGRHFFVYIPRCKSTFRSGGAKPFAVGPLLGCSSCLENNTLQKWDREWLRLNLWTFDEPFNKTVELSRYPVRHHQSRLWWLHNVSI